MKYLLATTFALSLLATVDNSPLSLVGAANAADLALPEYTPAPIAPSCSGVLDFWGQCIEHGVYMGGGPAPQFSGSTRTWEGPRGPTPPTPPTPPDDNCGLREKLASTALTVIRESEGPGRMVTSPNMRRLGAWIIASTAVMCFAVYGVVLAALLFG